MDQIIDIRRQDPEAAIPRYYDPSPRQRQDWESDSFFRKLTEKEFLFETWELDVLDAAALNEAVVWLVNRHESLRAYFPFVDEQIRMALHPPDTGLFQVILTELHPAERPAMNVADGASEIEEMERRLFIDNLTVVCRLQHGPLFRVYAIKMPGGKYKVTFFIHHIISDAWSVSLICRELKGYYQAVVEDTPLDALLPAPRITDYCRDKNRRAGNGELEQHRLYWHFQLKSFNPARAEQMWNAILSANTSKFTPEPYDQLGIKLSRSAAGCYTTAIRTPLIDALRSLARHRKISLRNVLYLGLYKAYQKCFGIDLILFASPVADRFHPKYKDLIGNLTAGIYLPQDMGLAMTAEHRLLAINSAFLKACRHLIFNHDDINLDGGPLRMNCNCFVNFEPSRDTAETLPEISLIHSPHNTSFYALACNIKEFANGLTFMWTYKERIHSPAEVERLASHFSTELQSLIDADHGDQNHGA